jgi:hypothetical protein
MSPYRRLKIEGGAFFYTLALADRGSVKYVTAPFFGVIFSPIL